MDTASGGLRTEQFMAEAILLAQEAEQLDEVPVGAVVVVNDEVIGRGHNRTLTDSDPTAHAEIVALRDAARALGNHRLVNADLYVTVEPCTMCAGALVHARVRRLYFGAPEPRAGAVQSTLSVLDNPALNHRVEWQQGPYGAECSEMMSRFFKRRR